MIDINIGSMTSDLLLLTTMIYTASTLDVQDNLTFVSYL